MIKKIFFTCYEDIKKSINDCLVLHAVPAIEIDPDKFYLDLIEYIGEPFRSEEDFCTKNKTGSLWSDIKYIEEKSESFSHSNTRQPFHTDGAYESNAPDISFFYCLQKAKFGGATTFINPKTLIDCLIFSNKNLLEKIKQSIVHHLKGNDEKKIQILKNEDWNWNYYRANKCEVVEEFHNFLEETIYKSGLYESVFLNPGEALFFWDKKLLHGRNSFLGNRHLRKAGIYV